MVAVTHLPGPGSPAMAQQAQFITVWVLALFGIPGLSGAHLPGFPYRGCAAVSSDAGPGSNPSASVMLPELLAEFGGGERPTPGNRQAEQAVLSGLPPSDQSDCGRRTHRGEVAGEPKPPAFRKRGWSPHSACRPLLDAGTEPPDIRIDADLPLIATGTGERLPDFPKPEVQAVFHPDSPTC